MILAGYDIRVFEFRYDQLCAANARLTVQFNNIWDPADNVAKNKSLTIVNTSGATKYGYEMIQAFVDAVNALMPGTIICLPIFRSVVVAYPYHDSAPFAGTGLILNENYLNTLGGGVVGTPHLASLRNSVIEQAAEVVALEASVATKQQQIDILQSSLIAAGGDSGAASGSTVVTVQTPPVQDLFKTGLAFLAGVGVGRIAGKEKEAEPWTR